MEYSQLVTQLPVSRHQQISEKWQWQRTSYMQIHKNHKFRTKTLIVTLVQSICHMWPIPILYSEIIGLKLYLSVGITELWGDVYVYINPNIITEVAVQWQITESQVKCRLQIMQWVKMQMFMQKNPNLTLS